MRPIGKITVEVRRKGKVIEKFSFPVKEMDCKPENYLLDVDFKSGESTQVTQATQ